MPVRKKWGVGGGASHLVIGHSTPHHELEEALAEFTGRSRALLFSTGYMANLGAVTALLGKGDSVLEDRLNHASLLDAGLLSGARFFTLSTQRCGEPGQPHGKNHRQYPGGHRRRVQHGR